MGPNQSPCLSHSPPSPKQGPGELLGAYVAAERLGRQQGEQQGRHNGSDPCAEAYAPGCPYSPFAALRTIAGEAQLWQQVSRGCCHPWALEDIRNYEGNE